MRSQQIDKQAKTSATPSAVYRLLRDGSTWPVWSPIGTFTLEQPGPDEPEGIGAIRVFKTGTVTSRERIVELIEDRRLSYELVSGLPICGYRADVDLEPVSDGTIIHWRSSFDPKRRGTGWFYRWFLGSFIQKTTEALAEYAARGEAATGSAPDGPPARAAAA